MEECFEWDQLTYQFFPYYWARYKNWKTLFELQDTDPLFQEFLKAGDDSSDRDPGIGFSMLVLTVSDVSANCHLGIGFNVLSFTMSDVSVNHHSGIAFHMLVLTDVRPEALKVICVGTDNMYVIMFRLARGH